MADYEDENMSDDEPGSPGEDHEVDMEDEVEEVDKEAVKQACLGNFSRADFFLEPSVIEELTRFVEVGGNLEEGAGAMAEGYVGTAQTVNQLKEWLQMAGVSHEEIGHIVEEHMKDMILRHFDPKKADIIFLSYGGTPPWLITIIKYEPWRHLIYQLAEANQDCLFMNYAVKLISDAGHQGEITSVSTACHQIDVFSRVLRTFISSFMAEGEASLENKLPQFTKMVCHGEHTYLYSQVMLSVLAKENKGGANVRRLAQEVQGAAYEKGLNVTPITLALNGGSSHPRACQALTSMLGRGATNPADIVALFKLYSEPNPPPVELIRMPVFMKMLVEFLFCPKKRLSSLNAEHKPKYFYLLAYAASVTETFNKKGARKSINKDELKGTVTALEHMHQIISDSKGSSDLMADLNTIFSCIRFPVVAMGVLKWVEEVVLDKTYFQLNTDPTPLHLVLVDEIVSNHPLIHPMCLQLLIQLFESSFEDLDVLVILDLKKMILDRMVHMLSRNYVLPVIQYIQKAAAAPDTDLSLIRYFISEVLDMVDGPYDPQFVKLFLPLLENKDITGKLLAPDGSDPVSVFISECQGKGKSA